MKTFLKCAGVFLVLLLTFSCSNVNSPNISSNSANIARIHYVCGNVPTTFWQTNTKYSAFLNAMIFFDDALSHNDIKEITIVGPSGYSNICNSSEYIKQYLKMYQDNNQAAKSYISFLHWRNDKNPHVLQLGKYTAKVLFANGTETTKEFTVYGPGKSSIGSDRFIYSPDFKTNPVPSEHTAMLPRASDVKLTINADKSNVIVEFKVNNKDIYNGKIFFYDEKKKLVAESFAFKNNQNKIQSFLNQGKLNVDGTKNVVTLIAKNNTHILFAKGKTTANIKACVVALYDGYQDNGKPHHYSHSKTINLSK